MATSNVLSFAAYIDDDWASSMAPTPAEAEATLVKVQSALDGSSVPVISALKKRIKWSLDPARKLVFPTLYLFDAIVGGVTVSDPFGTDAEAVGDLIGDHVTDCTYDGNMAVDITIE